MIRSYLVDKKDSALLVLLMLVKISLQFLIVNPVYDLQRDEYLHLDLGRHLALGYTSVPPFTSWISFIILHFGNSYFWVRFFPALFGALTIYFIWKTVELLKGSIALRCFVSLLFIFSVYCRMNILYQPNSFDILAWSAVYYFFIRYLIDRQPRWIYLLAIAFIIGFYNKYNIVFQMIGIIIALVVTAERTIFTKKPFWIGVLILMGGLMPLFIWQVNQGFPVVHHMQVLSQNQLVHVNRVNFLLDQLLVLNLLIPIVLAGLTAPWLNEKYKQFRPHSLAVITTLIVFAILRAKSYYAFGLYPIAISLGGIVWADLLTKRRMTAAVIYLTTSLLFFLITAKIIFPIVSPEEIVKNSDPFQKLGLLRWEDGKDHQLPQDFADMLGWKELAQKVREAYIPLPDSIKKHMIIMCDNYGQAGAINFYNKMQIPLAYSFNADYLFWIPDSTQLNHVLLVGRIPDKSIQQKFGKIDRIGQIDNPLAREYRTPIWLLQNATPDFSQAFYKEMHRRRAMMDCY